jgi:flagellar assembly factor FliW
MTTTLTFVESPPGLDPLIDFTLDDVEGAAGLHEMRSTLAPNIRLFVIDVPIYLPWYDPEITDESLAAVGLAAVGTADAGNADVLVVATITDGAPVVNLMAPVLVNRVTGAAKQLILGDEWPLAAQLKLAGAA